MESKDLLAAGSDFLHLGEPTEGAIHEMEPEYHERYNVDFGMKGAVEITTRNDKIRRIRRLRAPFGIDPNSIPESRTY